MSSQDQAKHDRHTLLLVGAGGRESALARKISRSPLLERLYVYPYHPHSSGFATSITWQQVMGDVDEHGDITPEVVAGLARCARELGVGWVICGPEAWLCAGLSAAMQAEGIGVFGVDLQCSRLESEKSFAKKVMEDAGIPTAPYCLVSRQDVCLEQALHVLSRDGRVVLKADGLAGGKGVFVCCSRPEVEQACVQLYDAHGFACEQVVVESFLEGRECSYFAWVMGDRVEFLGFAQDYKRLRDGDEGPNTGGMGCVTPVPWLDGQAEQRVKEQVVDPLLTELRVRGLSYCGFLYVGLMYSADGPHVLEFNVRLGDPECQVLSVADRRDWLQVMGAMMRQEELDEGWEEWYVDQGEASCAVCVVMASPDYPLPSSHEGKVSSWPLPYSLLASQSDETALVFGASLRADEEKNIRTHKGRLLSVVGHGSSIEEARVRAYAKVREIAQLLPGVQYRTDIAKFPKS